MLNGNTNMNDRIRDFIFKIDISFKCNTESWIWNEI